MDGRGAVLWGWGWRALLGCLLGQHGAPLGTPAVYKAILCWCELSSANVTHFQATHSPGSSLPPLHSSPLTATLPSPDSRWGSLPGLRMGLLSAGGSGLGQHGCFHEEKSQGNHPEAVDGGGRVWGCSYPLSTLQNGYLPDFLRI